MIVIALATTALTSTASDNNTTMRLTEIGAVAFETAQRHIISTFETLVDPAFADSSLIQADMRSLVANAHALERIDALPMDERRAITPPRVGLSFNAWLRSVYDTQILTTDTDEIMARKHTLWDNTHILVAGIDPLSHIAALRTLPPLGPKHIRFQQAHIDPRAYYFDPTLDADLPSLESCCIQAGHTYDPFGPLGQASTIVSVLLHAWKRCTQHYPIRPRPSSPPNPRRLDEAPADV